MKGKTKIITECSDFWNAVFKLVNEDRILPADDRGITTPIDKELSLTITNEWAMLVHGDTNSMCAKMRRGPNREDLLPYITLLSWYLKKRMD